MEASNRRRSRYHISPGAASTVTPSTLALVRHVAVYGLLTAKQLSLISGRSLQSVLRACRKAFDAGLLSVAAVPRAALVDASADLSPNLAYGSAPNVYTVSAAGLRLLKSAGLVDADATAATIGPKSALFFLAHRLMVTDARVWLSRCAAASKGHELTEWREGKAAEIVARSVRVRPDGLAIYRMGERVLVALVEADRNSEGSIRWKDKLAGYAAVLGSTELRAKTGFQNARLLVVANSEKRRDRLASIISEHAHPSIKARIWIADHGVFGCLDLTHPRWRQPGAVGLYPLVAPTIARTEGGG